MANPQITTSTVSTAFATSNASTATTSATNWSAQSLTGPSVSNQNGLSNGMNTGNIVQSNLTRTVPYSNYSTSFLGTANRYNVGTTSLGITSAITVSAWVKINY